MALKKKEIIAAVAEAAAKEAEQFGLEIWDVEYVKEGPAYVLRIYIDKPGGVFISDCVQVPPASPSMLVCSARQPANWISIGN